MFLQQIRAQPWDSPVQLILPSLPTLLCLSSTSGSCKVCSHKTRGKGTCPVWLKTLKHPLLSCSPASKECHFLIIHNPVTSSYLSATCHLFKQMFRALSASPNPHLSIHHFTYKYHPHCCLERGTYLSSSLLFRKRKSP